ncbi:MAG: acyl--CoA ligase [Beijerinckiaceae bacterium]|jgi:acyl-CoA synthetase (AMP-forming)/AMP-acid ligase II|nr:acyl--CoA ligase [Beijerinckiaceae bacterium]
MFNTMLTLLSASQMRAFYEAGYWRADTIYSLARDAATRAPESFALRDQHSRVTYPDLIEAADRLASHLHAKGVKPGQRVAVWLPSRFEIAVALLACSRNGYVCCPSLHRDHTVGDIADLLERMHASVLIAETGYGADAHKHDIFERAGNVESLNLVLRLEPVSQDLRARPLFADLPGAAADAGLDSEPDTIVYLAFTSGTTGVPKGVMHSDNTLLANARAISQDWSIGAKSVVYSMSPLSHNLGLGALVMTFARGGEFVVHDLPRKHSLVDRIVETGATFVIGVPTHAIDLLSELRDRGMKALGAVKGFRISGAAVPPSVAADLLDRGVVPQSGFGMTEAGSHHYTLPDDPAQLIIETSGRACAGYEVKIFSRDNQDLEAAPGEVGQIGGRGASLMLGYFDDQTATETSFNADGWFMTGDLGWMDERGYLRITGRKKDVIIRGGHNIYPARIESLVMRHPGVERAAVLPVADERLGEKVCLAIVPRNGQEISADEMLEHLDNVGLSKFDMPEFFMSLDQIPLTPSGKILKRDLVTAVSEGRLTPAPVRYKAKG